MTRYLVEFTPAARRGFLALPADVQVRLAPLLEALAADPHPAPPVGRKLKGLATTYRLREGAYRVVYEVHKDRLLVLVVWVGRRRDAYRR